ncbi:MAG TPA: cellulase family glycosylhydrolase, partial [bacterium]|nr:cellulase family glycosylhydrolase [bacterium]
KRNGLGVVLDMHQTPAPDIFHDPKELESYITLWKNLAAHYSRQPLSVLFEVINEPAIPELTKSDPPQWDIRHWRAGVQVLTDIIRQEDPNHYLVQGDIQHWRAILKSLIEAVRKEDPDRYIVVTGGGWGGAETLIQMGSLGFPRLIYDFHYYEPFMFTHQGAYWVDKSISTLKGIHYPVSESEVVAAWVAAKKAGFQEWPFKSYPHGFDSDNTRQNLEPLFSFAKKENIQLYCGEFGVLKAGPPPEDRVRWLRDVTDLFRENGVGWANWAYHASFDMADQNGNPDRQEVEALGLTGEK